jgi:hypothetical protein
VNDPKDILEVDLMGLGIMVESVIDRKERVKVISQLMILETTCGLAPLYYGQGPCACCKEGLMPDIVLPSG